MLKKEITLYSLFIFGLLLCSFLIYEHFSSTGSEFCKIGSTFDCGIVNKSPYANLDGFSYLLAVDFGLAFPLIDLKGIHWTFDLFTSNAFLGLLVFILLFFMFYLYTKKKDFLFIKRKNILFWMKIILSFGILYGFCLFLIQHFILKAYCIFCLGLDLVLILSLFFVYKFK